MTPSTTLMAAFAGVIAASVAAVGPAFAEFKRVPARINGTAERPAYDKKTVYGEFMELV